MSTKAERIEKVHIRAWEYAKSGEYSGWYLIERALVSQGLYEARSELDRTHIRDGLDKVCKIAQEAKRLGITYEQAAQEKPTNR